MVDQTTDTVPQLMITVPTGERRTIQITPAEGLTPDDVHAFRAGRREAGKMIDPMNCTLCSSHTQVIDPYGVLHIPEEWSCIGRSRFARSLPDGEWVFFGDLPEATFEALERLIDAGHFGGKQASSPLDDDPASSPADDDLAF